MSETRAVVVERNYDYLYDRHYQLSSERDHARATMRASMRADRVQMVPHYPAMFSDLRNYPRHEVRLINKDPVPKFINRNWTGWTAQAGSMLHRLSQMGDTSAVISRYLRTNEERAQVGGRDRARFFRRPILPYATQLPPDVVFAVNEPQLAYTVGGQEEAPRLTRTIATQTIYRDSEVQTDPFTPEYIVRPGEAPEVLTLATMTFGRGLPAGLHEVEMIERARNRRQLEEQLPPLSDFSQSEKRMRMMEAIEREEWRVREQQIEELQQLRLEVLVKLLRQREETHQEMSNKKLDRLWNKKQQEKEHFFHKLRLKHVKAIRQLLKKRKNVENKHFARDIVKDYSENSSQVWAPLMRTGQFIDRNSDRFLVNSRYLSTYNGLLDLEQSLPQFVLNPRITVPTKIPFTKAGFKKRKFREEERLQMLHETIKRITVEKTLEEKPLRFLEKQEKPIPRPPTPTILVPEDDEESTERSIIFLQQIIRGRAIQAMMFEGKEKRKELIEELRSTHSLLANEMEVNSQNKAAALSLQRQRILLEHREDRIDESLAAAEGESISDMFDFLSKELVRLQEERRIHAISMVAERERRIREAEQSGLRQVEERRRREHDEIFKQIIKVHQQSVDVYLQDIISENVNWTASDIARIEMDETARRVNLEAYESELVNDRLQQEGIVADLIHNFLIPEVNKRSIQERHSNAQRRFLYAAHREIHSVSDQTIGMGIGRSEDTQTEDVQVEATMGDKSDEQREEYEEVTRIATIKEEVNSEILEKQEKEDVSRELQKEEEFENQDQVEENYEKDEFQEEYEIKHDRESKEEDEIQEMREFKEEDEIQEEQENQEYKEEEDEIQIEDDIHEEDEVKDEPKSPVEDKKEEADERQEEDVVEEEKWDAEKSKEGDIKKREEEESDSEKVTANTEDFVKEYDDTQIGGTTEDVSDLIEEPENEVVTERSENNEEQI